MYINSQAEGKHLWRMLPANMKHVRLAPQHESHIEVLKAVMFVCVRASSAFNFILRVLNDKEVIFRACRLCCHSGLDKTPPQAQKTDTYLMR